MLCHSLAWRKLHGIDRLLGTYQPTDTVQKYYPGGWHYHDKGLLTIDRDVVLMNLINTREHTWINIIWLLHLPMSLHCPVFTVWCYDSTVYAIILCLSMCPHLDEQFLQSLDLVFSHWARFTVHRFICVYLCVFCVFVILTAYMVSYCQHGGVELMELLLTLLVRSFDL